MFLIAELILLSLSGGAGEPEKNCSVAGEEQVVDGDFLLEISFALIDREFRELFGIFFQVNFPKEEQVRTLPPDFPLLALDFLFSELKCLMCHFQPFTTQATHCTVLSRLWSSSWLCGDWRNEILQNTEVSSCLGVSFPTLSLLNPA